jgi:rare lipoprotein A
MSLVGFDECHVNSRVTKGTPMRNRILLSGLVLLAAATAAAAAPAAAAPSDVPPAGQNCWATHYDVPGGTTASGEPFNGNALAAATSLSRSPQLPFGTKVKVTNVKNNKSVTVRINDRGTFAWSQSVPKCLDLTNAAFTQLGGVLNPDDGHIVVQEQVVS